MLFGAFDPGELELRRAADGSHRLRGRFPYNKVAILSDGGKTGRPRKEIIKSGAFGYRVNDPTQDIRLLSGHDFGKPLASRSTRTLALEDTPHALNFTAKIAPQVADTQHGADALRLIESGLAAGVSVGFRLPPQRSVAKAEEVTQEPVDPSRGMHGALIRSILAALLYELSVVTAPAYDDATVQIDNSSSPSPLDSISDTSLLPPLPDLTLSDLSLPALPGQDLRSWDVTEGALVVPKQHASARWR